MINETVIKIREFNRFYMSAMNLLGNHYLDSEYSVPEARIFFEIYTNSGCNAAYIAKTMNIDKSYLSRILKNHQKNGYLYKKTSEKDSRVYELYLTEKGESKAKDFIQKSNQQIDALIHQLNQTDCELLMNAFDTIITILNKCKEERKNEMRIVPYTPKYKKDFIEMNKKWISEMFEIEEEDIRELENIESIIEKGGNIFFALNENDDVMACCMIGPRDDGDWEIMKFAAKGMYTGSGAGNACLKACIEYAKEKNIGRIIIVSNRKCVHALHLYRKNGFTEMPVDKEKFPFERADIAFEQYFR